MPRPTAAPEEDRHDRWLVSYADFMTLLFAFFVMLYALSSLDNDKYKQMAVAVAAAFAAAPTQAPPIVGDAAGERLIGQLRSALGALIHARQVDVQRNARGVAISINASLLFPTGSASLHPEAIDTLNEIARQLALQSQPLLIEGHTDDQPIASAQFPSNWELSSARASTVVRLFQAQGVAGSRLSAIGYADNQPLESNATVDGRARNRRVTVQLLLPAS